MCLNPIPINKTLDASSFGFLSLIQYETAVCLSLSLSLFLSLSLLVQCTRVVKWRENPSVRRCDHMCSPAQLNTKSFVLFSSFLTLAQRIVAQTEVDHNSGNGLGFSFKITFRIRYYSDTLFFSLFFFFLVWNTINLFFFKLCWM